MYRMLLITLITLYGISLSAAQPAEPELGNLRTALGGAAISDIKSTAVPDLYEVIINSQILYLSKDGRFVIQGDIIDLQSRSNLTEQRRNDLRLQAIEAHGENNMVIFAPDKPAKHTVTVFTDIDCGYCRRFHQQMEAYNQSGVRVRYLMFPRAGIGSDSYQKAVAVWCADDQKEAMTRAKRGESIEPKTCDNPVKEQFELGQSLGVRGTPSIILDSGALVPGYVPPPQLAQMLDGKN